MAENPQQMVLEGLEISIDYVPKMTNVCLKVLELIRQGEETKAKTLFLEMSEGLEWYTTLLFGFQSLFPGMMDSEMQGKPLGEVVNKLLDECAGLVSALNDGDFVLFGDILEYEIIPCMEYWTINVPEMITLFQNKM